jgi:hypothetical protein
MITNKARPTGKHELPKTACKISTIALYGEFGPPHPHGGKIISRRRY